MCGISPAFPNAAGLRLNDFNTTWSVILTLNMAIYIAISGALALMLIGSFFCPLWVCGIIIASIAGGCGQIAAIIVTGIFRYS